VGFSGLLFINDSCIYSSARLPINCHLMESRSSHCVNDFYVSICIYSIVVDIEREGVRARERERESRGDMYAEQVYLYDMSYSSSYFLSYLVD
jgi:hypothetical protein